MRLGLFLDIGSTYTKGRVVELERGELLASAKAYTTVETDVTLGINDCLLELSRQGIKEKYDIKLASSSAAGGLRMVAVGLVRDLTTEAAKKAALTAGARVEKSYSYELTPEDLDEILALKPDIILLAGGTDGGNKKYLLENARKLSRLKLKGTILVAGNRSAASEVAGILEGKVDFRIAPNVLPDLNTLNIEPVQNLIRQIFLEKIVEAKGLKKAEKIVDKVMMPTPLAVLKGAELLAQKIGELILIDVGGATTDVHSVAKGLPTLAGVSLKGLPEPYAKRTVEGDLGLRRTVKNVVEYGREEFYNSGITSGQLSDYLEKITKDPTYLPQTPQEKEIEKALTRICVKTAMNRHAGRLEEIWTPAGKSFVQYGKDLTRVEALVGTGGPLVYAEEPEKVLAAAFFEETNPNILKPKNPEMYLDTEYILFAAGLLAENDRETGLKLLNSVKKL
ncbi:methylaspartate mutase accessory protein GlmL [Carboxydothermus hydrogenoformans]|uniref:MutL protein n=1 Tax=Carboxydothermus hydrogenoformans (strain ATCC BAA-161 / DSM 6008 / Z-2901) TaxID=246194 RepID=Q3AFA6_CARHZ|nr:methylaspartate mutase accessory protein GlmL [Carboxydothermus hydrogenoformans]ABB15962.1 conserved hypothetical protein TIGR01319 [Carboxydothermus hydrogenoformans Z-2901]